MIKHLTVNMPLAVPTQKRPPSKYASHPYPILVDEDVYISAISPIDITLAQMLKEGFLDEAYSPRVTPLAIMLKEPLIRIDINNEAYSPRVTPLAIMLKEPLIRIDINNEAYSPRVTPLAIITRTLLIEHFVVGDAYQSAVKPLNVTLRVGV